MTAIRQTVRPLLVLCAAALLAPAAALAHDSCGAHQASTSFYGPFDLAIGDSLKFNLVAPASTRKGGPVPVTVRLFGADGRELGSTIRYLEPGAVDSVEIAGRVVPPDETGRTSVWATVSAAPPDDNRPMGGVLSQLVITDSQGSRFLSPGTLVGFNPQPEPPGAN